jgi:GNAT superfamily N-acetyltransferase
MKNIEVRRLDENGRSALLAHYVLLSAVDRSLRFGMALAPETIAAYVGGIDFTNDAAFGVQDETGMLVGAAHLAFARGLAEVGLSVLEPHRCIGIGTALFECAVTHARRRGTSRFTMHFQSANAPIRRIARNIGMDIHVCADGSAEAHLDLAPAAHGADPQRLGAATYERALETLAGAWHRSLRAARQLG